MGGSESNNLQKTKSKEFLEKRKKRIIFKRRSVFYKINTKHSKKRLQKTKELKRIKQKVKKPKNTTH